MSADVLTVLQVLGPAVAVYAAIRADMAAMRVRIQHLERKAFGGVVS